MTLEKAPKTSLSRQELCPSLVLPGSLPRIAAVPGTTGQVPPVAAFPSERRADEWSRREEAGRAGPLSPGMASPCSWLRFAAPTIPAAPAKLRGEGRLQEIAGSITMEEEPVI